MCTSSYRRRLAFTLIELLVVLAIIAVLTGLLLAAVQRVRESANRLSCTNNLKQIGLALHHYHDAYHQFPPGGITEGPCCATKSRATWTIYILPYLEQEALHRRYDFSKFNEDAANDFVRKNLVKGYLCPSDPIPLQPIVPETGPARDGIAYMPGSYRAVSGMSDGSGFFDNFDPFHPPPANRQWRGALHTVWARIGLTTERLAGITDGASNTLLVGECATRQHTNRHTLWAYTYTSYNQSSAVAQPRTLLHDYDRCQAIGGPGDPNTCKRGWGSFHPGGLNFVLCDGSVRFVSQGIDMHLFTRLATIAGGEGTGDF
jgi:prepilin-type N-terminal cleavage/methylation domain-containing protein/prepilin-type processing-associated H-X9-DG protein